MAKAQIMLVGDEASMALILQKQLTHLGYEVSPTVTGGKDAIHQVRITCPHLILMDILLAGDVDGVTIAARIQAEHDIPIIYVTAWANDATFERAKATTPYGYLVIPCTEWALRTTIDTALYRHQVEQQLRESEARYRALVEHSLGLMCVHDLDGTLLEVNPAACQALGYRPEEGIGQNLQAFLAPGTQHLFDEYLLQIRQQPIVSGLMRVMTKEGQERIWAFRNVRHQAAGHSPYVIGHAMDMTERMQAEAALRASEKQWQDLVVQLAQSHDDLLAVLNQLLLGVAILDAAGRVTFCNQACQALLGTTASAHGEVWERIFPFEAESKTQIAAMMQRPAAQRWRLPAHLEAPDGRHY